MNTKGVEDGISDTTKFDDNYSEAAAFAGITFSQACQFDLYMKYLCGKGIAPGFLPPVEPAAVPEAPTFAYQLAMHLTRNGGDEGHMQAEINRFLYDGKWQTTQGVK